jgi:hypothetical protein
LGVLGVLGLGGERSKLSLSESGFSNTHINASSLQNAIIHFITTIMSEGMSSWRSLASSAGTRFKGYINSEPSVKGTYTIRGLLQAAPQDDRQNWREWAERMGRTEGSAEKER